MSPLPAQLGEVESSRSGDDSGGGLRYEPFDFDDTPPPGAPLNAGSDLPQLRWGRWHAQRLRAITEAKPKLYATSSNNCENRERKLSRIHQCQLPNGMDVFYRSKVDVDILSRELLKDDNLYLRHGITIAPGDCIFDVGANIGFFILFVNKLITEGRLVAFEPIPDVFEVLQLNADRHNKLSLKLLNCGLSRQAGQAQFAYCPRTSVASTMFPDQSEDYKKNSRQFVLEEMRQFHPLLRTAINITPSWLWYPLTETLRAYYQSTKQVDCQLKRLSDVIGEQQIDVINLLKVDTEGAEEDVLAGIDDEHWPIIQQAVVEVHHGRESLARMEQLLQSRGFHTASEPVVPGVEHLFVVYARR